MICKDCVHYEVCCGWLLACDWLNQDALRPCDDFKQKSSFVEPPDDDAVIFVKDNWLMLNVESEHLGKAIKHCVDYLIKDAKEGEKK